VNSVPHPRPVRDHRLVQILDAALADATRRSGDFLVCRPGCTQCCIGVFAINPLDAARLQAGLEDLTRSDPARATRVRQRAKQSIARISPDFPGDLATGLLCESKRAQRKFEDFANNEACPALDPVAGTCDLYAHRPLTCRVFGPPVRTEAPGNQRGGLESGLGTCELCYHGATDEQIAACEMEVDPDGLESELLSEIESETGAKGRTIVAFALAKFA
jgi:Fe-S-cluster containining protein